MAVAPQMPPLIELSRGPFELEILHFFGGTSPKDRSPEKGTVDTRLMFAVLTEHLDSAVSRPPFASWSRGVG